MTLTLLPIPPASLTLGRSLMTSLIDSPSAPSLPRVSENLCDVLYSAMILWQKKKEGEKATAICKVMKEYIKKCGTR